MNERDLLERIRSAGQVVAEHSHEAAKARKALYRLLKQGRRKGLSLRVLADAAGLSNVRVLQVTRERGSR
jgi:lambda repressor-like predicted transcriptional regulator